MAEDYDVGFKPPGGYFYLPVDSDFVAALKRKSSTADPPDPWSETSTVELRFVMDRDDPEEIPLEVWESTPDDIYQRWNVDKADCAALALQGPKYVRFRYVDGDVESLWSVKRVKAV